MNRARYSAPWTRSSSSEGGSSTAFGTTNQYAYFYAEAQDGGSWGDSAGPGVYVTNDRFDNCYAIGHSTWRIVSMAELNVGWPPAAPGTHTINLNP